MSYTKNGVVYDMRADEIGPKVNRHPGYIRQLAKAEKLGNGSWKVGGQYWFNLELVKQALGITPSSVLEEV